MRCPRFAVALVLALSFARPASAELASIYGSSPRPQALGGAYTALSEDASALYYNPAGLALIGGSYAAVSFAFVNPHLTGETETDAGRAPLSIVSPDDEGYGFHFAWNPKSFLDQRLGLGFSVHLPHRRALAFAAHRLDDPYFVVHENGIQLLETRLGAAYRIFDFLSIGGSVLLLGGLDGNVVIEAPFQTTRSLDPNRRTVVEVDVFLPNREFFTGGIQLRPIEGLSIGFVYREASFVPVKLPIRFELELLDLGRDLPTTASLDVKVKYAPAQAVLGAAYQITPEWLVSLDLAWAFTSKYEIPFAKVTVDVSEFDEGFVLLSPREPTIEMKDVLVPRVGVEWKVIPELSLRAGYYFFDSFIESSTDPVLDSAKHSVSLGAGYALGTHLFDEASTTELNLMAASQMVVYTGRTTASVHHHGEVFGTTFGAEFRY